MSQTPLNDLLKTPVDEVETSPDDGMDREPGEIDETPSTPEAKAKPEPAADPKPKKQEAQAEPAKSEVQTDEDDADEAGGDTNTRGLPKAFHARVKAADERRKAAETTAYQAQSQLSDVQRELAEAKRLVDEWNKWYQQQTGEGGGDEPEPKPKPAQPQYDPRQQTTEAIYQTRLALGLDRATEKYEQSYIDESSLWAADRMKTDRGFWEKMMNAPDPVALAIREFKKAQNESELEKYGWDIDALVKARMASAQPQTQQAQQPQPGAGTTGARRQPNTTPSMPSDFASAPSGGGRTEPAFAGPTPLGDLLKLGRG